MVECFLCSVGRVLLSFAISTPLRTVYDNIEMQCSIFQLLFLLSSIILHPLATIPSFYFQSHVAHVNFFPWNQETKLDSRMFDDKNVHSLMNWHDL